MLVEVKGPYGYAQGKTPAVKDSFDPEWTDQVRYRYPSIFIALACVWMVHA